MSGYRLSHDVSSDDSEDSDKECNVWKRATTKRIEEDLPLEKIEEQAVMEPITEAKPKRKKNTIWTEVLQDQLISEDLEDILLKNKPRNYGSRGTESYDYTLKYGNQQSDKDSDSPMSDSAVEEEQIEEVPPKPRNKHFSSIKLKNVKTFVKLDSAELAAARKINKVLNEKKRYLIDRIVKLVGIEKAMKLLSMTQEVEDNGGMMINNNKRRRTPGGVYIQLLKNDKDVTKETLDKIFEGEMTAIEMKKFYAEKKKLRKKKKNKGKNAQILSASKDMSDINAQEQMTDEMVPMDAEICPENASSSDNTTSVPISDQKTLEGHSDLEEGEISDDEQV